MKINLLIVLIISILLSSCGSDDKITNPNKEEKEKAIFELYTSMTEAKTKFIEFVPDNNGNPKEALIKTFDWLKQQNKDANVYQIDSTYLYIESATGQKSMFWFKEIDEEGISKYRGGGGGEMELLEDNNSCSNVIENKKVLIYAPGNSEFYYSVKSKVPQILGKSDQIEEVTHLKNEKANIEKIKSFGDYGLVLMETHGNPYGFMTGDDLILDPNNIPTDFTQFKSLMISQLGETNYNLLVDGDLILVGDIEYNPFDATWWEKNSSLNLDKTRIWAAVSFIEKYIPSLKNTVVVGNFCFSGMIKPSPEYGVPVAIAQSFLNKNPITYYGYQRPDGFSKAVDNLESMAIEDSLITRLIDDSDSTGAAFLKADDSKHQTTWPDLFLEHMGKPDWCYNNCNSELVDSRDGSVYKIVCIGKQTWMAENLRYSGAGICFENDPKYCKEKGRLYSAFELLNRTFSDENTIVQGLCPDGWHVPSNAEYEELIEFAGGGNNAIINLRSKDWPPNPVTKDLYGFNLIPTEAALTNKGEIVFNKSKNPSTYLWTSSGKVGENNTDSYNLFETRSNSVIKITSTGQSKEAEQYYPCRCIKDKK